MNGILAIDKKQDQTSFDVVREVRKLTRTKKIGHTGTLDPLATGVLVLAIGQATKIIELLEKEDKEYIATIKMGILTDTLDITGTILERQEVPILSKEHLKKVLKSFQKTYFQEVPLFSAVHVNGKRLYEYARNKEEVVLPKKEITIKEIELLDYTEDTFKIRCVVSKGTYIRSLIRDIGSELGILCTMSALRRTRVGNIDLSKTYKMEDVINNNYKLTSIVEALKDIPKVEVDAKMAIKIKNGCKLPCIFAGDKALLFDKEQNLLAIYKRDEINSNIMRVFKMF